MLAQTLPPIKEALLRWRRTTHPHGDCCAEVEENNTSIHMETGVLRCERRGSTVIAHSWLGLPGHFGLKGLVLRLPCNQQKRGCSRYLGSFFDSPSMWNTSNTKGSPVSVDAVCRDGLDTLTEQQQDHPCAPTAPPSQSTVIFETLVVW